MSNLYYDREMRALHKALQVYSEKHYQHAANLNLNEQHDKDPSVESLLEGVAYLSSEMQRRIDDDIPEISRTFLSQFAPELLQPIASSVVVEFYNSPLGLQKTQYIPAGMEVKSKFIEASDTKLACQFSLQGEVKLNPLEISQVKLVKNQAHASSIQIDFCLLNNVELSSLDLTSLGLYLKADYVSATSLYYFLCAQTTKLELLAEKESGEQELVNVPLKIEPLFRAQIHNNELSILQKIKQFFAAPEQNFFLSVQGLQGVFWGKNLTKFSLLIHAAESLPETVELNKKMFRLHCSPALNLYTSHAEPIHLTHKHFEYPLLTDLDYQDSIRVSAVKDVSGIVNSTNEKRQYRAMQHNFSATQTPYQYCLSSHQDILGYKQYYLSFSGHDNEEPETISSELWVNNAYYPRQYLKEGDVCLAVSNFPSSVTFKNITRPSQYYDVPERDKYLWMLLSQMTFQLSSLTELEHLQMILKNCDWTGGKGAARKIAAIKSIETKSFHHLHKGVVYPGVELCLAVDESAFLSHAEVFLFGDMLHQLFEYFVQVNCLVKTKIHCQVANKALLWRPSIGRKLNL